MKKMAHVSAYRLLSSLRNMQIVYISSRRTPCISRYNQWFPISRVFWYIIVYMLYIDNLCLRFLDGIVLIKVSFQLSLMLY